MINKGLRIAICYLGMILLGSLSGLSVSRADLVTPENIVTAPFDVPGDSALSNMLIEFGFNTNNNPDTTFSFDVYDAAHNDVYNGTAQTGSTFENFSSVNTIDTDQFKIVISDVAGPFNLDVINVFFSNDPSFNSGDTTGQDVGPDVARGRPEFQITATPLPAALPLFATGLGAMGLLGWRRKRKNAAVLRAA